MKKGIKEMAMSKLPKAGRKKGKERKQASVVTGIDLGDRSSRYFQIDKEGNFVESGSVPTTTGGMQKQFGGEPRMRIVIEAGTHSPWVSRLLQSLGHEVIVANPRKVRLIAQSTQKNDDADAEMLARLGRFDPKLLCPVTHRSQDSQRHLMQIRVRAHLIEQRTATVNCLRGLSKNEGERIAKCDADQVGMEKAGKLPEHLAATLAPLFEMVEVMTGKIKECDKELEQIAAREYPEVRQLTQVFGVGTLIALTFILTIDDPNRFAKSRDIGCYLGLKPKQRDSGDSQPQLGISKEGDAYLRSMLVQGAHCVMARRAPETDLKRWGQRLAAGGGKRAKKRAIVAVARKLGILLHRLWVTGAVYEPCRNSNQPAAKAA